jgi:hypothetical protein
MAGLTVNSNYSGVQAGAYFGACIKSGLTLSEGNITFLENVKYKQNLTVLTSSELISNDTDCSFSTAGALGLTDRVVTPVKKKLNVEVCKRTLETDWQANEMVPGVNNSNFAGDFTAFMMDYLGATIGESVENDIWRDLEASTAADATVIDVVGAGLNANNIVAELGKVRDKIPVGCYGKEDLTIYMPTSAIRFYISAMSELGYMNLYYGAEIPLTFEGIKLAHAPGMTKDVMIASRKSNLVAATDLISDFVDIRIVDMSVTDASQNLRVAGNFSIGANHAIGKDVVRYA